MTADDLLEEYRKRIVEILPKDIKITDVDFEGPNLVIYTESPKTFADDGAMVKILAKELKKRIIIRPNPEVLMKPEEALKVIHDVIPKEGGIQDIYFEYNRGEVVIEAEKLGLVIGKKGAILRDIIRKTGWRPRVIRSPPIQSSTIKDVRRYLRSESDFMLKFLRRIGRKIHTRSTSTDGWARLTALGGCKEVGRSAFLLSTPETRILVDCGVNVSNENETPYLYIPEVSPIDHIDAVVVTHAHLDHSGLVPLLFKYGYDGPVYTTMPTRDLMMLLQLDYIEVSSREGKRIPYNSSMIREVLRHIICLDYGEVTDIAPDVKLTLFNAGHILGSAIAYFHIGNGFSHNIAFTGDIKYERTLLFEPAVNDFPRVETLVMESTYGGVDDFQPSRKEAEARLQEEIKKTISRGGKVIIPAFAVGRSQEVMLVLEESIRKKIIDDVPVYLDGMIWEATSIHSAYPEYLNRNLRDLIFHNDLNPFLSDIFVEVDDADKRNEIIESNEPSIIISTAGMLNGGPVMEYLKGLAADERNMLIFVGYQAEGTLGRRIQKGWNEIQFSSNGRTVSTEINMEVKTIDGFSGHSDRNQLLEFIRRMRPQPSRVICVHGEERKCLELASAIYKRFNIETRVPTNLETIRLV